MVLLMARLKSRKNSSIPPFRERVPADVLELAKCQRPTIRLQAAVAGEPDVVLTPKLGGVVWFSSQTNDPILALQRQTSAKLQLTRFYDVLRNGPKPLTQIQIVELAGIAYRQMVADHRDEPGDAEDWALWRELTVDALEEYHQDGNFRGLEHSVGRDVDALLSQHSIVTDKESRKRLIVKVAGSIAHAADRLRRNAEGDYSPDKHVERYAGAKGAITGTRADAKANTKLTLEVSLYHICVVPGCGGRTTSRYSGHCSKHKGTLRRHGAASQQAVTRKRLKPYLGIVQRRIGKNPHSEAWVTLDQRWRALGDHVEGIVASYQHGNPAHE